MADRKTYRATMCFGASSSTDDLEGELEPADGPPLDRARVEGPSSASAARSSSGHLPTAR